MLLLFLVLFFKLLKQTGCDKRITQYTSAGIALPQRSHMVTVKQNTP